LFILSIFISLLDIKIQSSYTFKTLHKKRIFMKPQTQALHTGYENDAFGAMAVPLYQTTAYDFGTAQTAANRFALKELGPIYTRLNNPTTEIFETRMSALEHGAGALAVASGQAAIFYAVANLASAGDTILVARKIYGGATTLLTHTLAQFGIKAKLFDSDDANDLESQIDDTTKAIFFESLSNPHISISDFDAITSVAKKYKIVTVCDNTVATPFLCRPLDLGVDVVVHSASKYISGQGLAIGGAIVEREKLNELLIDNPRYPQFNTPDKSYHGLVYATLPFPIYTLRARLSLIRDIGAAISPFNSWQLIQGLETLSVRIKTHSQSALEVAKYLNSHPKVSLVRYPGLKSDEHHEKLLRYFHTPLASGLIHVDLQSPELATKLANDTKLFSVVVNIGDSKSLITQPAATTHQQVPKEELAASGVTESTVRLSIGLEDPQDLIDDLASVLG
jgi:O-acetylhomoserine (thiol)-lyase